MNLRSFLKALGLGALVGPALLPALAKASVRKPLAGDFFGYTRDPDKQIPIDYTRSLIARCPDCEQVIMVHYWHHSQDPEWNNLFRQHAFEFAKLVQGTSYYLGLRGGAVGADVFTQRPCPTNHRRPAKFEPRYEAGTPIT